MPRLLAAAALASAALLGSAVQAAGPATLHRIDTVAPVTNLVAARTDGLAIAQVGDALRLVDSAGGTYPFAQPALRALAVRGTQPRMVALAPLRPGDTACPFPVNELVVGVPDTGSESLAALDAQGLATPWLTSIPDGSVLAASFDRSGRFGQTLLILVDRGGDAAVEEIDCRGGRTEVAGGLHGAEPGIAVLPPSAGSGLAGSAVVATTGGLVTVTPHGIVAPLAVAGWSDMVQGPVAGMEVVPAGFVSGGGWLDAGTSGGLVRADAAALAAAGVADGDVLVATGRPARLVDVHCAGGTCVARAAAETGEDVAATTGPAFLPTAVRSDVVLPRDPEGAGWTTLGAVGVAVLAIGVPGVAGWRRRRAASLELEERLLDDHPAH